MVLRAVEGEEGGEFVRRGHVVPTFPQRQRRAAHADSGGGLPLRHLTGPGVGEENVKGGVVGHR